MLKTFHILHDFSDTSVTRIVGHLVSELRPKGYEFLCASAFDSDTSVRVWLDGLGAQTVELQKSSSVVSAIREYVIAHNVELVHSHTPRTSILTALAL
jgi:hypothetical protein